MPMLVPAGEFHNPDLLARYPFKLITPPHPVLLNSTFGEKYSEDVGEVLIHPEDAGICEIEDGSEVILENDRGRVVRRAKITEDTQRGLLVAEGIFWPKTKGAGAVNDLTSQKIADMGGGATFHECLVALRTKG